MDTKTSQPFCPNCDAPLNAPESVIAPPLVGFFGNVEEQCDRHCTNCGQSLSWLPTGLSEGSWVVSAPVAAVDEEGSEADRVPSGEERVAEVDAQLPEVEDPPDRVPTAALLPLGPRSAVVVSTVPGEGVDGPRAAAGLNDRVLSLAELAASTPWSEAVLSGLAKAPGSPFHLKAGIWVTRESAFHRWIESDEAEESLRRPFQAPTRNGAPKRRRQNGAGHPAHPALAG